jgi:aromatic-L-amino-acid decarboxylase
MDNDEFRARAHECADWMADYLRDVGMLPVTPATRPGEVRARLPAEPPEQPEPFDRVLADFRDVVVPGMTHWNHPGWLAYFPANNSPPSILAEMLVATMGAQCMSWATSPAATELEQVVMGWLGRLLDLPPGFTGVIQDSASSATLAALLCARERATDGAFGRDGAAAPGADRLVVYATTEAHSSVDKGVRLAGLGQDRLRRVPIDGTRAMRADALDAMMARDVADGWIPCAVVATVGTTSSSAIDPLAAVGPVCRRHGAWLHVDAAWAGSAAILPEKRAILDGVEHADSLVTNPHKWLLVNFDCSAFFVRDVDALLRTFRITPEYLKTGDMDRVADLRDWGIPLGRRFRALKLWFVLRAYGAEGLRAMLRRHLALADGMRRRLEEHPDFELLAPVPLALLVFRWRPAGSAADDPALDAANAELLRRVNASGRVHLTHTVLDGFYALRMSIGQRTTGPADVDAAWTILRTEAEGLRGVRTPETGI